MTYLAVLPSIVPDYTAACLASMCPELRDGTLVIDNTEVNRGVSRSWNMGIDAMGDADWLVIVSAAVRFGAPGGADFLASLDEPGLLVMEAMYLGWHCIGFHRDLLAEVGRFDEGLFPGWGNDLDYGWRIAVAYGLDPPYWDKLPFDMRSVRWAHSELAGVRADPDAMLDFLRAKWGNVPGSGPTWDHPYNLEPTGA